MQTTATFDTLPPVFNTKYPITLKNTHHIGIFILWYKKRKPENRRTSLSMLYCELALYKKSTNACILPFRYCWEKNGMAVMTFRSCQVCQQRIKGLYFHFLLAVAYQIPFVAISKDKKN